MNSARSFKEYYDATFQKEDDKALAQKLSDEFFADFIHYIPIQLDTLDSLLNSGQILSFYQALADLKYLIEFSDNLSRYWHLLRAYSGALSKLKADQTVKGSKRLYSYYFENYGDRRMLRNEHWFEKKRWEFLDALHAIYSEHELHDFMQNYHQVMVENYKIYQSFLLVFVNDLKNLESRSAVRIRHNS